MESLSKNSQPIKKIPQGLSRVPSAPGVYLMKDSHGEILYIGKAQNLKKRLASYFGKAGLLDVKTAVMMDKIANFETIITAS
jgi:excinuclease ABC subunit C